MSKAATAAGRPLSFPVPLDEEEMNFLLDAQLRPISADLDTSGFERSLKLLLERQLVICRANSTVRPHLGEARLSAGEPFVTITVHLDPVEADRFMAAQIMPLKDRDDIETMGRTLKLLLAIARAAWLRNNVPMTRPRRRIPPSLPSLSDAELAAIREADRNRPKPSGARPHRVMPRATQGLYMKSYCASGRWPGEWGPPPDEPGTAITDPDVRMVYRLGPVP